MGIDAGFDMVPRLSKGAEDQKNWQSFIKVIKERYQNDNLVEIKPNYLIFKAGEHPQLPFEGHKLLRFSSKISGSHGKAVAGYIVTVTLFAQATFGSRVQRWNEAANEQGFYSWPEVYDSIKSYKQPHESETPTPIAQSVFGTDPIRGLQVPLFEIQTVPGKGKGLVARFNIAKGTRILYENPLFTTSNLSPIGQMEINIATKLKALSKTHQRQFLSLHNNFPGKYPFSGIVKTNALPCGPSSLIGGIYPTICFINHSCLSNAHNSWNSDIKCESIHAIRYINAGEEITISYDKGGPSDPRRMHLKDAFGFDCNCGVCSLSLPELQISDARRLQIQHLDDAIGDSDRIVTPCFNSSRKDYRGDAGASIARLYYDAVQISITHGDQARASVFGGRAYKSRVICEGEDSPETRKVKNLMDNPAGHRNFGASMRWKTTKGLVPKGLDAGGFERWLWRQGR